MNSTSEVVRVKTPPGVPAYTVVESPPPIISARQRSSVTSHGRRMNLLLRFDSTQ
jgi:hypothetical protein